MARATLPVAANLSRLTLATVLVFGTAAAAVAQTSTWTGGGASDAWSDPVNWSGTAPTSGGSSALTFAGSTRLTPNDDLASYMATAVTFDPSAGAFVLGGNSLALAGDVTQNSANLQTINQPLAIDFTTNRTFNTAAGSLTLGGAISTITGTGRIVKTGAGTLTLTATNANYTNGFTVLAGVLSVSNDAQLGQITGFPLTPGYIVLNGGTLQFTGTASTLLNNRGVAVGPAGTGNSGFGTIDVATGLTVTYNGVIANNTDATGTGTGGLIKTGPGTFVFGGTSTYSGPTFVQNGAVRANNSNRIPPGVLTLGTASTSARLVLGNSNTTAINETLTGLLTGGTGAANSVVANTLNTASTPHTLILNIPAATTDTFDGIIGGTAPNENNLGVTLGTNSASGGPGTFVPTGANTYLGPTTLNSGTLRFSTLNNLGNGTAITFGGGTLQYAPGLATPPRHYAHGDDQQRRRDDRHQRQ